MSESVLAQLDHYLKHKRFDDAIEYCDANLAKQPDNPLLTAVKGWSLFELGRASPIKNGLAEKLLEKAIELAPADLRVVNFGLSFFMKVADYPKVVEVSQRYIELKADEANAGESALWRRLGTAQHLLGESHQAISAFKQALAIEDSPLSKFGMSLPLLSIGEYEAGFNLYENRFMANPKLDWLQSIKLPMPRWGGQPISGKSILIWSEQGLGDTIQFSRLMTVLSTEGASVDLILSASHAGLSGLLKNVSGVNEVIVVTDNVVSLKRRYDFHSSVLSLIGLLNILPHRIPTTVPYVFAPSRVRPINFSDNPKKKIAVVWSSVVNDKLRQSDPMHFNEKLRKSIPMPIFETLFTMESCQFFSLNLDRSHSERRVLSEYRVIDLADDIETFSDTASFIDQMDLVVSIDTAVVHLAGAMAKPVINLLPFVSDWRWRKSRERSDWYPTMIICQQTQEGNWQDVIDQVRQLITNKKG